MDLEALLSTFDEVQPSGEDLEYDPVFTELELAAQPQEERQVGSDIIPGGDPDYRLVQVKALEVLDRSNDLRAAVFLAEAELRLNGLPGFSRVTQYIQRCLSEHWASCYPQLDEEDDNDAIMRVNAVSGLADYDRIINGLHKVPLTKSKMFGEITLRDIAISNGDVEPSDESTAVLDAATVSAAFQDTNSDELSAIKQAGIVALDNIASINSIFDTRLPGGGPNLDKLTSSLQKINRRINEFSGSVGNEEVHEDGSRDKESNDIDASTLISAGVAIGGINSQIDVRNALDKIIAYYSQNEPSSPVPILLVRAKKLVGADFVSIMKDMAPNGLENVRLVGGIESD
jgi:type VI secretion system protein ImpA